MPESWKQHWQHLAGQLPHPHRDGVSLPCALLLSRLRRALNGDELHIEELQLADSGGVLTLLVLRPVPQRLQLHFAFAPVEWAQRCVHLDFQLNGNSCDDDSLSQRVLGKLLQLALESGLGLRLLQRLAAPLPWLTLHEQRLSVHLDAVPVVGHWLARPLLGVPLAERIRIDNIHTCADAIRIHFALQKPPHQG